MKILAIGAHADDVELGCGGSLLKWSAAGNEITIFTATDSEYRAPDGTSIRTAQAAGAEAAVAADKIGAKLITGQFKCFGLSFGETLNTALVELIAQIEPDMVLSHWDGDTHSDHKSLALSTLHACRRVPNILMYQSNWYAGASVFDGRYFVDITATFEDKLDLIKSFQSEIARTGDVWLDTVRNQATMHGRENSCRYAEAFQIVRISA